MFFPFFFFLFSIAFLGPPEVNISSHLNGINVTIKLPTSYFRKNEKLLSLVDIYEELYYVITLKTLDGEHKVKNFIFYLGEKYRKHKMALMVSRFTEANM